MIECKMKYSPGGMNYTDVHVKREATRIEEMPEEVTLQAEEPVVYYGEEVLQLDRCNSADESRLVQHQDNRSESLDENNYVQEYDFETVQHFQSEKGI